MSKQAIGPNQRMFLDALRSGQYEQGIGVLCTSENKHCCLGVAGRLFVAAEKIKLIGINYTFGQNCFTQAPDEVVTALNLYDILGGTGRGYSGRSLVILNDEQKLTFSKIADKIEEDPAVYFSAPA